MEELIDNTYDNSGGRPRSKVDTSKRLIIDLGTSPVFQNDGLGTYGLSIHATPTKRKRQDDKGNYSANILQRRCFLCKFKTP